MFSTALLFGKAGELEMLSLLSLSILLTCPLAVNKCGAVMA